MDEATRERWGFTVRCHLCGGARKPTGKYYEFGLGKNMKWTRFVPNLALLVGGGEYLHVRLALCDQCAKNKRVWGWLVSEFASITELDCQQHPLWTALRDQGYRQFIYAAWMRALHREDVPHPPSD